MGLAAVLKPGNVGWKGVGLAPGCGLGDGDGNGELAASGDGLTETAGASGGRVGGWPPGTSSGGTTDVAGGEATGGRAGAAQAAAPQKATASTMLPVSASLPRTLHPPARDAFGVGGGSPQARRPKLGVVSPLIAVHVGHPAVAVADVSAGAAAARSLGLGATRGEGNQEHKRGKKDPPQPITGPPDPHGPQPRSLCAGEESRVVGLPLSHGRERVLGGEGILTRIGVHLDVFR